MPEKYLEYQEERFYSMVRMSVVLVLTFLSFFISSNIIPKIQLVQLVLGSLMIVSLAYHALITYIPDRFITLRKNILLVVDFSILTFFINIMGEHGIYLLPLYTIIVMQSSGSYGLRYYISGALIVTASLAYLAFYSSYWQGQYEIIVSFGFTALLVPLFHMKTLLRMGKKIGEAEKKIAYVDKLEEKLGTEITGVKDREHYKAYFKKLVKRKETFTLLFISLEQSSDGEDIGPVNDILLQNVIDDINNILDKGDFLARLSEHEFAIITRKSRAFLRKYLQKLETTIISVHRIDNKNIHIEPNIGVALYPEDGQTEMTIAKCADEAMNAVKEKQNVRHLFYRGIAS